MLAALRDQNEQLRAHNAELAAHLQRMEAVAQLTASTIHDTRNALHVVLGQTELLAPRLTDPAALDAADGIRTAAEHAVALCRDVLTLSAREHQGATRISCAEFVRGIERLLVGVAGRGVQCVFDVPVGLWPIEVQPQQLTAALINLVANAREAMPDGGTVFVSAWNVPREAALRSVKAPGDYVGFAVQDSGQGMTPEVLARATEPFFTTRPPGRGTGLGLPMVVAFAERAGGGATLMSEPGRGTRVEILLPRAVVPAVTPVTVTTRAAVVEAIRQRVRTPALVEVLDTWAMACPADGLPRPLDVERPLLAHADRVLTLAIDTTSEPPGMRLLRMGRSLLSDLEASGAEEADPASALFASPGAAPTTAVRSRLPSYEVVEGVIAGRSRRTLERLYLPAATDGATLTHLYGVVLLALDSDPVR